MKSSLLKIFFFAFFWFGIICIIFKELHAQENIAILSEPKNQIVETEPLRSAQVDMEFSTRKISDIMRLPEARKEHKINSVRWSDDGKHFYFRWQPPGMEQHNLYSVTQDETMPRVLPQEEAAALVEGWGIPGYPEGWTHPRSYNDDRSLRVYIAGGDIFLLNTLSGAVTQLTHTPDAIERMCYFICSGKKVAFFKAGEIYILDLELMAVEQVSDFENWEKGALPEGSEIERHTVMMSSDGNYLAFIFKHESTTSGLNFPLAIYNVDRDSITIPSLDEVPGIYDPPEWFLKEYPDSKLTFPNAGSLVEVKMHSAHWHKDAPFMIVEVLASDWDRFFLSLNPITGKYKVLHREHDEATVGGPGTRRSGIDIIPHSWMPDNRNYWFQSEEDGFNHLYAIDTETGIKRALTSGNYEITQPQISPDGRYWYFWATKTHPGIKNLYRMPIDGGKAEQLTDMKGGNHFFEGRNLFISPDGEKAAFFYSFSNRPRELYLINLTGSGHFQVQQITQSLSQEFATYLWRKPELVSFRSKDGTKVYARLFQPEKTKSNMCAVIYVHGAGYWQHAQGWWASENLDYFFHNFLADEGYTVLAVDYRGSAGYGRDFRVATFRHIGGKDVEDLVAGAEYLVRNLKVHPNHIGVYGISYGGALTLAAMFKQPQVFAAGAAICPVSDWSLYEVWGDLLPTKELDPEACDRSSPISYVEGFEEALLICHALQDPNVVFEHTTRLIRRLMELGKEDWEVAIYPDEAHLLEDPVSLTDQYKRILKLFEANLK